MTLEYETNKEIRRQLRILGYTESTVEWDGALAAARVHADRLGLGLLTIQAAADAVTTARQRLAQLLTEVSPGPRWQHLDTREIDGRTVVWHWPAKVEAFCLGSGRAVQYEAGDRCLRHGAANRPCTTGLRTPPECRHEHLSPNHPHPHCSECGQDAEDVTVQVAAEMGA